MAIYNENSADPNLEIEGDVVLTVEFKKAEEPPKDDDAKHRKSKKKVAAN